MKNNPEINAFGGSCFIKKRGTFVMSLAQNINQKRIDYCKEYGINYYISDGGHFCVGEDCHHRHLLNLIRIADNEMDRY